MPSIAVGAPDEDCGSVAPVAASITHPPPTRYPPQQWQHRSQTQIERLIRTAPGAAPAPAPAPTPAPTPAPPSPQSANHRAPSPGRRCTSGRDLPWVSSSPSWIETTNRVYSRE
ncbi:hypothetical protein RSAG8_08520, partial [Rhizoctonia solani AG-8 WAC10335]